MSHVISTTVYEYSELSESAKARARDWYREASAGDEFYAESVIEDAAHVADILGIDLRQTCKTLVDGSHRYDPTIHYSGFSSQGDGACFVGKYSYKKGASKAIRAYAPKDVALHRIADELQATQKRHFYKLWAKCSHNGRYYHSGCMAVEVWHDDDQYRDIGAAEDEITRSMQDFADWIYRQLEQEYEYSMSYDVVAENIEGNEYTFTEDGEREG